MNDKTAVFYFSCIPYDYLNQRPQQLFRAWRSSFTDLYEFYYIDDLGVRRFVTRCLHHLKQRLENLLLAKQNNSEADAFVLTCPGIPRSLGRRALPKWVSQGVLSFKVTNFFVRRMLDKRYGNAQKKVAILANPFFEPFVSKDDFDLVCYDYLDPIELYAVLYSASEFYQVQELHRRLVAKSDIVFVTAQNLNEEIISISDNKDVIMVSNGTDADFFERNKKSHEIADYTKTNRKIVGYMGSYHRVDMDLIYTAARRLAEVDFLLIGPIERIIPLDKQLGLRVRQKPSNVFILGTKDYNQLPAYVHLFDVALIPFKPSDIADSSDPVKLYDYFSLGKPVVATRLKELKKFDDGRLLRIAETPDEFVNAIKTFLEYDVEAWRESRRQIARQNSWLSKATLIIRSIESKINENTCA